MKRILHKKRTIYAIYLLYWNVRCLSNFPKCVLGIVTWGSGFNSMNLLWTTKYGAVLITLKIFTKLIKYLRGVGEGAEGVKVSRREGGAVHSL